MALYGRRGSTVGQTDRIPEEEVLVLAQCTEVVRDTNLLVHFLCVPAGAEPDVQLEGQRSSEARQVTELAAELDHPLSLAVCLLEPTEHPERSRAGRSQRHRRRQLERGGQHAFLVEVEEREPGIGLSQSLLELGAVKVRVSRGVATRQPDHRRPGCLGHLECRPGRDRGLVHLSPQEVVGPETPGGRVDLVVATKLNCQVPARSQAWRTCADPHPFTVIRTGAISFWRSSSRSSRRGSSGSCDTHSIACRKWAAASCMAVRVSASRPAASQNPTAPSFSPAPVR